MSVDIGTAEGHVILDTSGFISGLDNSINSLENFATKVSATFGGALQAAGQAIENFGASIDKYISAPIRDFGKTAFTEMADFEDTLNRAGVIMGANGGEMDKLRDKAIEMGRATKYSGTQAAEAYTYMGMAGWKTEEAIAGLEGVMSLAAASGEDLGTVSDIVTDALTALKMGADETSRFVDVLAQASLNSNTNVGIMGESFKYAASLAGELGYNCEDLGVVFGLMANQGIKGSQAGTAFRSALMQMLKPTSDVKAIMDKYNISLFNVDGTARPLLDVLGDLRDRFADVDQETKVTDLTILGGARGFQFLSAIVGQTDESYGKFVQTMYSSQDVAKNTAEKMQQSYKGQFEILKGVISTFMLQFEDKVLPLFTTIVEKVSEVITKFTNLDDGTKEIVLTVGIFAAAIGPLVTAIGGMVTVFGTVLVSIGLMISTFTTLGALIGVTGGTFAALAAAVVLAFGEIMAGIALLAGAFTDLVTNNSEFRNELLANFDDVKKAFLSLWEEFKALLKNIGFEQETFGGIVKEFWGKFTQIVAPVLVWIVTNISNTIRTITGIFKGFVQFFDALVTAIKGDFIGGITGMVSSVAEIINSLTSGLFGALLSNIKFFHNSVEALRNDAATHGRLVRDTAKESEKAFTNQQKAYDKLGEKQKETANSFTDILQKAKDKQIELEQKFGEDLGIQLDSENKTVAEKMDIAGSSFVESFDKKARELPGRIANTNANSESKMYDFQMAAGEYGGNTGSLYISAIDFAMAQVPGIVEDYLAEAEANAEEFAKTFKTTAKNTANDFLAAFITELSKLPAAIQKPLADVTKNLTVWAKDVAAAGKTAADNFNTNALTMASTLKDKLKTRLNESLNVAKDWAKGMGREGANAADAFLDAMLDAVDETGGAISAFGEHLAEYLTYGIESKSEWIKERLKDAYYKIIDEMEYDMGISSYNPYTAAKSAKDYNLGYSTLAPGNTGADATRGAASSVPAAGGNTFIFNSPKAIDEVEASRLLRKTQQDMLLGF